jgi:hypothetical protein
MNMPGRLLTGVLALAVLAGVFLLYTQPDFMVQMANQVWACF